tara:strand:+ start:113 stop:949 length:837 start_codon:yes stop_codon:yes gene_type:complete
MPEGPETRRDADKISRALLNVPLKEIYFKFPKLKRYEADFVGTKLILSTTKGKGFVLSFDNGLSIYCHLQLYGKWHIGKSPKLNTNREIRMELQGPKKSAFLYSASTIEVLPTDKIYSIPYIKSLGPDVLDIEYEEVENVLNQKKYQNRSLGILFLDQKFLAGMGNYLRSEILFQAKLSPNAKLKDLNIECKRNLAKIAKDTVMRSYKTGGYTVDEVLLEKRKKKRISRFESLRFYAFGRVGKDCPFCEGKIVKENSQGRRFYSCTQCIDKFAAQSTD